MGKSIHSEFIQGFQQTRLPRSRKIPQSITIKSELPSCESGGIGRRTRLRIWRVKPWGFESPLSHQIFFLCLSRSYTTKIANPDRFRSGFYHLWSSSPYYCCAYTPIQPFALCVVQSGPACRGTNTWLLVGSTAT